MLHLKNKRVTKMEDFEGLKIRTPSRVSSGALKALGAVPVPVPGIATMAEIMIRDVVNGVITPWAIARAIKVVDASTFHADNTLHGPVIGHDHEQEQLRQAAGRPEEGYRQTIPVAKPRHAGSARNGRPAISPA